MYIHSTFSNPFCGYTNNLNITSGSLLMVLTCPLHYMDNTSAATLTLRFADGTEAVNTALGLICIISSAFCIVGTPR